MKHAVYPVIEWPLILMGIMPLCLRDILRVDLTIPIVTFCSQFWVYVRITDVRMGGPFHTF